MTIKISVETEHKIQRFICWQVLC